MTPDNFLDQRSACVTNIASLCFPRASLHMCHIGSVCRHRTAACAVSLMLEHIHTNVSISFVTSHPINSNLAQVHQSYQGGRSGELFFDTHQRMHVQFIRPHRVYSLVQEFELTGFSHSCPVGIANTKNQESGGQNSRNHYQLPKMDTRAVARRGLPHL